MNCEVHDILVSQKFRISSLYSRKLNVRSPSRFEPRSKGRSMIATSFGASMPGSSECHRPNAGDQIAQKSVLKQSLKVYVGLNTLFSCISGVKYLTGAIIYNNRPLNTVAPREIPNGRPDFSRVVPSGTAIGKMRAWRYDMAKSKVKRTAGTRISAAVLKKKLRLRSAACVKADTDSTAAAEDEESWSIDDNLGTVSWPTRVNGEALLNDLTAAIRRYVILQRDEADAVALWALHTHAIDAFSISPRLGVTSVVMRCGKSTLLDLFYNVVRSPMLTSNTTGPGIYRQIDANSPTLLIDEADTFLPGNAAVRGILNSGHRKKRQLYFAAMTSSRLGRRSRSP